MGEIVLSEIDQPKDSSKLFVDAYFKLPKETFELFIRSVDIYMKLHRAWLTASDLSSKGKTESKELYESLAKNFKDVYDNIFEIFFRPMRIIEGIPLWSSVTFIGMYEWFKPFKTMISLYPKDVLQLFSKIVDSYRDFLSAQREYYNRFYKAWLEASEKLARQFAEKIVDLQKDQGLMDFWSFYDLWQETLAKTYIELLSLPDMVSVQSKLINSIMDLTKYWREMLEAIVSAFPAFPLPTKSEMDYVYKSLYLLRKEIDNISKKIEEHTSK